MRPNFLMTALVSAGLAVSAPLAAQAADQPAGFWTTPTIAGYGKIHYLPKAAYRPKPDQTYRIVFLATKAAAKPDAVSPALDHVARTVNLYTAAGVPLSHLKLVAVVAGPDTPVVMNNAAYKARFGVDNPNLKLIAELRKAGVDVAVCGQAVAESGIAYDEVNSHVTLALSALTTITTLEHQGYSLFQI